MDRSLQLEDYLAIPYILGVQSVRTPDGDWVCRVDYEELPGCVAEGQTPFEALAELERMRVEYITRLVSHGVYPAVPRAPLRV